jgi:hypothetical protein
MDSGDLENGQAAVQDAINALHAAREQAITLPPGALRRIARLHARSEGAAQVAQAAIKVAQDAQSTLQQALNEACEDEGLHIPADSNMPVDIDWKTGRLQLKSS